MTNSLTDYITDGKGTAYTIMVTYYHSNELADCGFPNGVTLYTVFSGGTCYSNYDEYELTREMPGDSNWVIDELHRLEGEL